MAHKHVIFVSLLLGLAAVLGAVAAIRTAHVGQASASRATVSTASIMRRQRSLDRVQASLHRALMRRPPKLPKVPSYPSVASATAPAPAAAPAPPAVQYVRPAPVVIVKHHAHGDDGHEAEQESGDD
jgi:hypothetical protein